MNRSILVKSGISGAIAVVLGAMGAHFLKSKVVDGIITPDNLQSYQTGVQYQMYHSLALLALAALPGSKTFKIAGNLFLAGIILFSGSIYILSLRPLFNLSGLNWLGPVTPIGGICLIAGWVFIFAGAIQHKKTSDEL